LKYIINKKEYCKNCKVCQFLVKLQWLKRVLVDGGYVEDKVYHFYITDHLGNNGVVAKADGSIQKNHYYPFGMSFAESTD